MAATPELALTTLGFTELEARLYFELLRDAPNSGYRLAQKVGKAPTNIYQALKSLAQKGAVIGSESDGDATTWRPVSPGELIAMLDRNFADRRSTALRLLEEAHVPARGELVFQLRSASQVLARARTMLDMAKEIVLFDLFPQIYAHLQPHIDATRRRGVRVVGITYDPDQACDHTLYNAESAASLVDHWPGLGMILIADGEQELIAQISHDMTELLNGVWSDSAFLSCAYHSALAAEIRWLDAQRGPGDRLKSISLLGCRPPGLRMQTSPVDGQPKAV